MSNNAKTPKKEIWQPKFIKELCRSGNVSASCRKAKISRAHAYEVKKEDAVFAEAWADALIVATEALEEEARRRALTGVLEPVFQGGVLVGKVRKYSDTLMIFLLKAHKPTMYRENSRVEHVGTDGGPVQIELSDTERAAKLAALLDAARDRRDQQSTSDGQGDLATTARATG